MLSKTSVAIKHEISKYVVRNGGICTKCGRSIPRSVAIATVKTG